MTALRQIIEELEALSPERREEAAQFIHRLREEISARKEEILERSFRNLDPQTTEGMAKAIEEGCEQVDADGW